MALTERSGQQITILEDGQMQVCTVTSILKDGEVVAETRHRSVVQPGDDTAPHSDRVKQIAATVWDVETVNAFTAAKAKANNGKGPK